jgi:glutamate carboxypeptidase
LKKNPPQTASPRKRPPATETRLDYFQCRTEQILHSIRQLVEIESPSDVKQAVDRLGAVLAGRFSDLGGQTRLHPAARFGNHLQVDFAGSSNRRPVLLLGHLDTVYPIGTLAAMPCRIENGRISGPGTLDMKSGIALLLEAIEAIGSWYGKPLPRSLQVLLVSDEEVGSSCSRPITEALAKQAAAVLVLEPSFGPKGAVKTSRKGVAEYSLTVEGVAAHAGLDFAVGQSAIVELSRQILEIAEWAGRQSGLTVNVGVVEGGTRPNVVPARARAVLDVRIERAADEALIEQKLRSLRSFNPKCKLEIAGGLNRPPMERSAGVRELYERSRAIARQLGWELEEASVGGGSDGNFTAALGVPTLDGLGGVGEGAHANHEAVLIRELPRRAALLAGLIEAL